MSKGKRSRHKTEQQGQGEVKTRKRFMFLPSLLGLYTLLGGAAAIVVFFPRPVISPPSIPLSQTIFSVSFEVINNGYIPLEDCGILLGVGQINTAGAILDRSFIPDFKSRLAYVP